MSAMSMAKLEGGIRAVLAFVEALNRRDLGALLCLLDEDCRFEDFSPAPDGTVHVGKESITVYYRALFEESDPGIIEVEEAFGLGFRCVLRWRLKHAGGISACVRGVDIFQIKHGLINEKLSYAKVE